MKLRYLPLAVIALAAVSCDRAKNLANKARSAVEGKIAENASLSGDETPDPELMKFVDKTDEGVIFRKDLAMPERFEVRATRIHEINGRFIQSSAIETQASVVKGTQTTVTKLERAGGHVRYSMEQSTFTEPVAEGADKDTKPVIRQLAPASPPRVFHQNGESWKGDPADGFRGAALAKQIAPVFDDLLVDNALAPRPLWFANRRFKPGDELVVTGTQLPMLVTGKAKGELKLTFESIGAVKGHPCGIFTFSGHYSRTNFPDFEGNLTTDDITIQSGKLWLSLLYPMILREESETVQTQKSGGSGGPAARGQGTVKVSVIREWKAVGS